MKSSVLLSRGLLAVAFVGLLSCGAGVPAACAVDLQRKVSLDAEDATLPSVLKILAEKGDLNVITGPGVAAGHLTIHMKDVPIEEAVNLVVRAAGLAYERIGNSILVANEGALKEETGLSSYIVPLKFASAEEVRDALKSLTADIQLDKGGNQLIVVTSPRVMSEVHEIVATLDQPAKQVMLEARVIEVSTDDAKTLGVDWDLLNRQGFVIVEGNPPPSAPGTVPSPLPFIPNPASGADFLKFQSFSRQAKAFQVAIDLMISEGNARVLANPKLATLNGHEANILVGQRIPFEIQGTTFAGNAASPTTSIQTEEVGIKLRITPLINADGFITTKIEPEVSSASFRPLSDLPVINTRQASTTVRLKDGNSVIIGGLLSENKTTNITKVPLLGSIPGLGVLFQHHSITSQKTDLVIEVTPRILPEQP
ncbi:MAG TPA: secretin N-terminal domain-containing protein [Candidatus Sulfotelmatobacter sp.]|nr:secretin N-terminal domain-containing protein [Candidatus Sulfotelmatobacter sp.]